MVPGAIGALLGGSGGPLRMVAGTSMIHVLLIPLSSTLLTFTLLGGVWISTFSYPSRLLCLLLLFGRCLDIDFFVPLSSTLLTFTLRAVSGYRFLCTPIVYFAYFYSSGGVWISTFSYPSRLLCLLLLFGLCVDIDFFVPLSSTLLTFTYSDELLEYSVWTPICSVLAAFNGLT